MAFATLASCFLDPGDGVSGPFSYFKLYFSNKPFIIKNP